MPSLPTQFWGIAVVLKPHEENYELDAPLPPSGPWNDLAASSDDAEEAADVAAAYLLQQVEEGHAHLRVATAHLARRAPDLEVAFAHLEATRRTLELVGFYLSYAGLECNSASGVMAARNQLSKQHRGVVRRLRNLGKRHQQYVPALGECPALV